MTDDPTPDARWWHQAACQGADDATFFPADGMDPAYRRAAARDALAICAACPVRLECLDDALREERGKAATGRFGVRGGLTSDDRFNLERRITRATGGAA